MSVVRTPPRSPWRPSPGSPRCREPAVLVLFGSTGDLTRRKLFPAIYSLTADGLLPCGLPIVCVGRRQADRGSLLAELRAAVDQSARWRPVDNDLWAAIAEQTRYVQGDLREESTYTALGEALRQAGTGRDPGLGRLFYLATPPGYFPDLLSGLKRHGLATDAASGEGWSRVVIEKPFGTDSDTCRELNALIARLYAEQQIYRMDHYLGKETVQNVLALRFANSVFEPIWNERHVSHVDITVAETVGMEGRGTYFDSTGMLRDVVQNHVLQMLALVAMEPPVSMDPDDLADEKLKVLRCLCPITPANVDRCTVRGQYQSGTVEGQEVPGYLSEPDVAPDSRAETYVALRVCLNNWRWAGVPFFLRAGKRLARRETHIVVTFRRAPHLVFRGEPQRIQPNRLILHVQPNEGVELSLSAKEPGPGVKLASVALDFRYAEAFAHEPPEAYERLILDALLGNRALFARGDLVQAAWDFITPVLKLWEGQPEGPVPYAAGSWGPAEADRLVRGAGGWWRATEKPA
jgi:glucose-6-phosphate 1-dehydrogenase